jgi:hypothetical protein
MSPINLLHDLLSPADGIDNRARGGGNLLPSVVLRQLPRRKDTGGDQQHTFPALINPGSQSVVLASGVNFPQASYLLCAGEDAAAFSFLVAIVTSTHWSAVLMSAWYARRSPHWMSARSRYIRFM